MAEQYVTRDIATRKPLPTEYFDRLLEFDRKISTAESDVAVLRKQRSEFIRKHRVDATYTYCTELDPDDET